MAGGGGGDFRGSDTDADKYSGRERTRQRAERNCIACSRDLKKNELLAAAAAS